MNVILFQPRFEPLILAGKKTTTIRPPRRDGRPRARSGEQVSLRVWSSLPYRNGVQLDRSTVVSAKRNAKGEIK